MTERQRPFIVNDSIGPKIGSRPDGERRLLTGRVRECEVATLGSGRAAKPETGLST